MSARVRAAVQGHFVLLRAEGLQLVLPQAELASAVHLDRRPRAGCERGLFELDEGEGRPPRRVAALSARMRALEDFPEGRFLVTSFAGREEILLAWDDAKVLIDVQLQPRALPPAMAPPGAPLCEYVELGDELAFCCTADRLLEYAFGGTAERPIDHAFGAAALDYAFETWS